jgi:hypothetical protein
MPYIDQNRREVLDPLYYPLLDELKGAQFDPGEVNYVFTRILWCWWCSRQRYSTAAWIMGTLVMVGFEIYRRAFRKYEDDKWDQNGDVYE